MGITLAKLRSSKYATFWIAIVFMIALFAQCCLFCRYVNGISVFSCFIHPRRIFSIYMQKAAISLLLASLVFLFRRKYWTLYVLIINAVWILAECIYKEAFNNTLIDAYSLSMVGNLNGFVDSIFMYFHIQYLWLLLPILIMVLVVYCFDNRQRAAWIPCVTGVVIALGMNTVSSAYVWNYYKNELLSTCSFREMWNPITTQAIESYAPLYSHYYSSIHAFIRVGYEMLFNKEQPVDVDALTDEMHLFVQPMEVKPTPQTRLVIFLVESLENWAIIPEITPNICNYIDTHHTLYASRIQCQTKKGGSMDGQILVNTGILPLKEGASCFRFPRNRYPALSELYTNAALLVPGGPLVWNQGLISNACGIDTNYTVSMNDAEIFQEYERVAKLHDYVMVVTASSHSPFKKYADSSDLVLPNAMPELMRNYLKTINFMDRYLGHALRMIDESEELKDELVVITGDHTIFSDDLREAFDSYCQSSGEGKYLVKDGYCPLILGGGRLEHSSCITDNTFQMDIYPTVLHAIGCDSFYWKGWGVNLSDSVLLVNRSIGKNEAEERADNVIRSNWFEIYEENNIR